MWSILHDMAAIGCPLPVDSKWVWGGDRRQQERRPGPQWEFFKSWSATPSGAAPETSGTRGKLSSTAPAIDSGLKLMGGWVVNPKESLGGGW